MQFAGPVKRIIPFLLTFSAGLLLASLFIPIGLPDFSTWRESRRGKHSREYRDLRNELDSVREKLRISEIENEQLRRSASESVEDLDAMELPPGLEVNHPPAPPRRPKHPRFDNLR